MSEAIGLLVRRKNRTLSVLVYHCGITASIIKGKQTNAPLHVAGKFSTNKILARLAAE
jgi:hypothetical protein